MVTDGPTLDLYCPLPQGLRYSLSWVKRLKNEIGQRLGYWNQNYQVLRLGKPLFEQNHSDQGQTRGLRFEIEHYCQSWNVGLLELWFCGGIFYLLV